MINRALINRDFARRFRTVIGLWGAMMVVLVSGGAAFGGDVYHVFKTRPGVTVPALIVAPEKPRAIVVLFSGGKGALGVQSDGSLQHGDNFLVESRGRFAQNGLVAVVLDQPTDRGGAGLEGGFRESAAHAEDIKYIMAALRRLYDLPLWLVGTSRGAASVANAGVRLQSAPPDGLVLTASVSRNNARGDNLLDMDLARIQSRVLVAHHLEDDCRVTPYAGAVKIEDALSGSRGVAFLAISGGEQRGNPCKPFSHHGFLGQRDFVVKAIASWIFESPTKDPAKNPIKR